ncbi:MAG: XRE family transcriptional regulator [Dehalococcoidia bacterium]|nr:XRE family transcriptional regulator [Dehalococcoidia bacterium]
MEEVNPELVTLARQVRGLTQAKLAEQSGLGKVRVSRIEAGVQVASSTDLERLATALDFPSEFFLWRRRVHGPTVPETFHRKKAKATASALHRLHAIAALRQMHLDILLRSWEIDQQFPRLSIDDYEGDPRRIAQTVRAIWNVPPGPIFNITDLAERAGAVIMSFDFETRDIDGFSRCTGDGPPIIFINESLPPDRWRWTVAHEMGHITMHCESDPYPTMETDANSFAGELLMPAREIGPQLGRVTIDRLASLKRYWKVSMQAILMRARALKRITDNQQRYLFMQLSKAGYRLHEPDVLDPPVEPAHLLLRILSHYRRNLQYTVSDLSKMLALNERDLRAWYLSSEPHLRAVN